MIPQQPFLVPSIILAVLTIPLALGMTVGSSMCTAALERQYHEVPPGV
jgi:hypothetical protein